MVRRLVLKVARPPYLKAVTLFSEYDTQRNNPYDYQAELKKLAVCNHRHHLPRKESDQPPSGNSNPILSYYSILISQFDLIT